MSDADVILLLWEFVSLCDEVDDLLLAEVPENEQSTSRRLGRAIRKKAEIRRQLRALQKGEEP